MQKHPLTLPQYLYVLFPKDLCNGSPPRILRPHCSRLLKIRPRPWSGWSWNTKECTKIFVTMSQHCYQSVSKQWWQFSQEAKVALSPPVSLATLGWSTFCKSRLPGRLPAAATPGWRGGDWRRRSLPNRESWGAAWWGGAATAPSSWRGWHKIWESWKYEKCKN